MSQSFQDLLDQLSLQSLSQFYGLYHSSGLDDLKLAELKASAGANSAAAKAVASGLGFQHFPAECSRSVSAAGGEHRGLLTVPVDALNRGVGETAIYTLTVVCFVTLVLNIVLQPYP